jgi:hypothetical protein
MLRPAASRQCLQNDGNAKLDVLQDAMPRKAEKVELDNDPLRSPVQCQAHGFVDDSEVALEQRQRFAEIIRCGRDIEQQPRLARICLLGEVQPESGVVQRLSRIFEKRALRRCGDSTLRRQVSS